MKAKTYTDEQIVGFLRDAAKSELAVAEFCRQKGFQPNHLLQVEKTLRANAGRRASNGCASWRRKTPN